jgi:hypothetical protein
VVKPMSESFRHVIVRLAGRDAIVSDEIIDQIGQQKAAAK